MDENTRRRQRLGVDDGNFLDETAHRFRTDAEFNAAVTVLEQLARQRGFTPYELKQIAFAAALRIEQTATHLFRIHREEPKR